MKVEEVTASTSNCLNAEAGKAQNLQCRKTIRQLCRKLQMTSTQSGFINRSLVRQTSIHWPTLETTLSVHRRPMKLPVRMAYIKFSPLACWHGINCNVKKGKANEQALQPISSPIHEF
jgi:hypothetical protein